MPLKMSMTRCCETARLSMRNSDYPIKLLVFPLINILLGHADPECSGRLYGDLWDNILINKCAF